MYEYETVRTAIRERGFDKRINVTKSELPEHIAKKRCEFATQMLKERPNPED